MKLALGKYCSGQKDSSMTFPFFHSMVTHIVVLSFVLTLPLDRGSLTAHSLGSLLIYLGDEEMQERVHDRNILKADLRDPGKGKNEELRIGEEVPGIKNGPGIDKTVPLIREVALDAPRENTGDKVSHPPPTALTSVNERRDETFVSESPQARSDQMKATAIESVQGSMVKKNDEMTKAIAGTGSARASELSGAGPGEVVSSPEPVNVSARSAATAAENGPGIPKIIGKGTQTIIKPVSARQGDTRRFEEYGGTVEAAKHAVKATSVGNSERMGFGLPKVEEPTLKDIKIEVALEGGDAGLFSMDLFRRPYPVSLQKSRKKNRQDNVACAIERKGEDSGAGLRQMLSVVKAEKGIYTFVIGNKGTEGRNAAIVFHLCDGRKGKRTKEYKTVRIQPGAAATFKFIIPEALFWDDEDRFSGEIEDSISTTKFHYESGVVWREDKD